ncbi:MAG TPA: RidA family protein [Alcaligenes sp.]|nr:RidA family protein [Alcaligenes sp.]HRL26332.1 RidA family protein [Alcaligenes sp.]
MRFFALTRNSLLAATLLGIGLTAAQAAGPATSQALAIKRYASDTALPFSRAVQAGGFLFLSGQIPINEKGEVVRGSIQDQTKAVLDRLEETLTLAGADLSNVVKATVWLSDMALYDEFNKTYQERLGDHFPARSLVQAKLVAGVDVEIELQAWVGDRPAPGKK